MDNYQNYVYLNNGGYTEYGDFRPPEVWREGDGITGHNLRVLQAVYTKIVFTVVS